MVDGKRLEIRRVPDAGYADPIVLDPLTQYFDGGLYRLWPSETYYARGGKKLHRDVWTSAFGEIPPKHHIHHKDGNAANNRIDNLECLPASEHLAHETRRRNKIELRNPDGTIAPRVHFSEEARKKAADWHKSEEGRLWHKRNAERTKNWQKWTRVAKPCGNCGLEFMALERKSGHTQKYCTPNCKAAAYRKRNAVE